MKKSGFLFLILGLISCCLAQVLCSAYAQDLQEITIFHTNDLHSHMHPPKSDEFGLGGLARMATLMKTLRKTRDLSITVDAGDWSEGTWYYNLDTGANMLELMSLMDYDAIVVGNHDYYSGPDQLMATVEKAKPHFPVLAANLDFQNFSAVEKFKRQIPSTVILQRGGLRIGVIGLTYSGFAFARFLKPVIATDPIQVAIGQAKILRSQVDLLIVLSHNDFSYNVKLAGKVPGIDAVISGHTHKKVSRAILVSNGGRKIPVVETGAWGTFLGELRLRVNSKTHEVAYAGYRLHPVRSDLQEDPAVAKRIEYEDAHLAQVFGGDPQRVIGETEIDLDHSDSHRASLGDLTAKALRQSSGAEAAAVVLPFTGVRIPVGLVTVMDAHDVMPHLSDIQARKGWTTKIWNALGSDLKFIVEILYLPNAVKTEYAGFLAFDHMEVIWMPKHGLIGIPRIHEIQVDGKPLDPVRRYSVAIDDGMLAALQTANEKFYARIDISQVYDTGAEGWQAILAYITQSKRLTVEELRNGGRSYTMIADPAVYSYGIRQDALGLVVDVANEGLAPMDEVRLRCLSGEVDDSVLFGTDEQIFSVINTVDIPRLSPGGITSVHIPWSPRAGLWPVSCVLLAEHDGYLGNSKANRLLRIQ